MRSWILNRSQHYARLVLVAVAFLVPVAFTRRAADPFMTLKFTLVCVGGVLAAALWVAGCAEKRAWPPRLRIFYPAAAVVAATALATVFSDNRIVSLIGSAQRFGGLVSLIVYVGMMVLIALLWRDRPLDLQGIAWAIAAASAIVTVYVLIQAAGLDWIAWRGTRFPLGTLGNSNFAGGFLGIALVMVAFAAASTENIFARTALATLCGLQLAAIWHTHSRGGLIAAAAGLATMAFFHVIRRGRLAKAALSVFIVAALAVSAFVVTRALSKDPDEASRQDALRTKTLEFRYYYWTTALRIFFDNPIVGTGPETYLENYPRYRLPEDGAQLGLRLADKPHNVFLEYASSSGILGLGAYLFLLVTVIWYGIRRAMEFTDERRLVLTAFLGMLAAYLAQAVFSIDVPPIALMGWIALGAVAAIADPGPSGAKAAAATDGSKSTALRWAAHVPTTLAALTVCAMAISVLLADISVRTGQRQSGRGEFWAARQSLQRAIGLHPLEASYRAAAGLVAEAHLKDTDSKAEKKKYSDEAIDYHVQALEIQPRNVFLMRNLADSYELRGSLIGEGGYPEADRQWEKISAFDPTNWKVRKNWADMLAKWGRQSGLRPVKVRAAEKYAEVVDILPEFAAAWIDLARAHRAAGQIPQAKAAAKRALEIQPNNPHAGDLLASLR